MSYHLAMRSLLVARRAMPANCFSDSVRYTLMGDIPAAQMSDAMSLTTHQHISSASLSERLAELMAVDINPVGQVFRLARSETAYQRSWDAYNRSGNVVAPVFFEHLQGDLSAATLAHPPQRGHDRSAQVKARRLHEGLLHGYKTSFDMRLKATRHGPHGPGRWPRCGSVCWRASWAWGSSCWSFASFSRPFPTPRCKRPAFASACTPAPWSDACATWASPL